MVKRLATSPHDPLGITDSACKNQLVVVSVQYGPFNPYIPIRSTTIGKSRVAIDPIAMHTSWRSNSDIASVTRFDDVSVVGMRCDADVNIAGLRDLSVKSVSGFDDVSIAWLLSVDDIWLRSVQRASYGATPFSERGRRDLFCLVGVRKFRPDDISPVRRRSGIFVGLALVCEICCVGNPGSTAGRGFNPAGGAPGDSIGYPRMSASGESSTTMHRLLHASGSHPIPTPYDPKLRSCSNCFARDLICSELMPPELKAYELICTDLFCSETCFFFFLSTDRLSAGLFSAVRFSAVAL
ncbi:hypothetical protein F511_18577 [Dorcoceras hygrometricum]|uniref:Uncharacterized protein n=1 Tax=Dorcoceras hygrometricum TaxID=472368 RepID=A0A2Z7AI14_9LAMI|nr:hypothetical protein F511_18577 [Dorcoceras hygrometricum]